MVKFTIEKFIEKAIKKHGPDRYDYSLSVYRGCKAKLIIKCNKCGFIEYKYIYNSKST